MEELLNRAFEFRKAIVEALEAEKLPETMSAFPRGCCGDSALLLGTYPTDKRLGDFTYVWGQLGPDCGGSHAWLIQQDVIIDITRFQFSIQSPDVTVTRDSEWYAPFEIILTLPADLKGLGDSLETYYWIILALVDRT